MKSRSKDLRVRIVRSIASGKDVTEVVKGLDASPRTPLAYAKQK